MRRYAELDGLLHHPGEPLPVACPDRQRQLRRRETSLQRLHFHLPVLADPHEAAGAHEAGPIPDRHDFAVLRPAHAQVVGLAFRDPSPRPQPRPFPVQQQA